MKDSGIFFKPLLWTPSSRARLCSHLSVLFFICFLPLSIQAQYSRTPWPKKLPVPTYTWTDMQGGNWSSKNQLGKVVIINFWATWCAPCLAELPTLQALSEISDPDRISVITVNVRQLKSQVLRFTSATSLHLPVVLDPKGEISQSFDIRIYPTTLLIDTQGVAQWRIEGDVDWTSPQVTSWIQSLNNSKIRR